MDKMMEEKAPPIHRLVFVSEPSSSLSLPSISSSLDVQRILLRVFGSFGQAE